MVIVAETVGTAGMTAVMIAEIHIEMTDVTADETTTGATAGETGTTTAGETVLETGRLTGGDGSTARLKGGDGSTARLKGGDGSTANALTFCEAITQIPTHLIRTFERSHMSLIAAL